MRRTKIVATIGPASSSPDILRELISVGVDVFRLNFSHGTREEKRDLVDDIRAACVEVGREVAVLQDLCGPKIRVGRMCDGGAELVTDSEITISVRKVVGDASRFSCPYKALPRDVKPGSRILLDDGEIELRVLATAADEVRCRVVHGGILRSHKGMNLPGTAISSPSVTQKDVRDLAVGLDMGVDFIALSFVRHPDDIRRVRRTLQKRGTTTQIIAKIEKPEAMEHIDEIIQEADGIMVARGDLGVEMDLARVPVLQKDLIRRANEADKFVITATQMLESMTSSPTPTRAEVTDVANAIVDGTDAVMLSGETAAGDYPVEAVRMMDRIARCTEDYLQIYPPKWDWTMLNERHPVNDAIGHAVLKLCQDLEVKMISAYSQSGATALFLSKSRPFAPILTFSAKHEAVRRMRMYWGVEPVLDVAMANKIELRQRAMEVLKKRKLAEPGDRFLVVAGNHFGQVGATDAIEIAVMKE